MRLKPGWLRRIALALVVGVVVLYGPVEFPSRDEEVDLKGWLIPTAEADPAPAIMVTHGTGRCHGGDTQRHVGITALWR